jgi:hypothetical protein
MIVDWSQIESPRIFVRTTRTKSAKGRGTTKPVLTGVFFHVPVVFHPELLPELVGYENEANWLLNRIISLQNTYKHHNDGYVRISRQTMTTFVTVRNVDHVKGVLLREGIIECDNDYLPARHDRDGDGHSMGYCLAEPYQGDLRRIECTKKSLAAKIKRHRINYKNKPMEESELEAVHIHLLDWLKRLKIDIDKAYQAVDEAALRREENQKQKPLGRRKRRQMVQGYATAINKMTVDTIVNEEFEFTVCRFGRVHTNVTRLLTEARACLSIYGQPLVNIDIRNSQVVFFSLLLLEHCYNRSDPDVSPSQRPIDHDTAIPTDPQSSSTPSSYKYSGSTTFKSHHLASVSDHNVVPVAHTPSSYKYSSLNFSESTSDPLLPEDVRRFIPLVVSGDIYDCFMQRLNVTDRKSFKQQFFRDLLFGDPNEYYQCHSKMNILFRQLFPTVHRFIINQKQGGYEKLAQRMQQRESCYMIGQVCTRLMQHHPQIPVITIHDSVLTTPEHVETVHRVMLEEFTRLGIKPVIRIEETFQRPTTCDPFAKV